MLSIQFQKHIINVRFFCLFLVVVMNNVAIGLGLSVLNNNNSNNDRNQQLQQQQQKNIVNSPPTSPEDVVRQAVKSIGYAFVHDGINRQSIRLPLSESMYGDKVEGFVADRAIGWQGGPQETLRYLSPLVTEVLKKVPTVPISASSSSSPSEVDEGSKNNKSFDINNNNSINDGGLPPRISEQVLLDFDGSSLMTAENPRGALYDAQALLQPNTDRYYTKTIRTIEEQFSDTPNKSKRMFLLVNPAWRDKSSWGVFGGNQAQKQILDRYEITYAVDQFVIRGKKVSVLKAYPNDWSLFVGDDSIPSTKERKRLLQQQQEMGTTMTTTAASPTLLGTFAERPIYAQMDELLLQYLKKT